MGINSQYSYRPNKIIITLTPSSIVTYPLNVLTHNLNVLSFRRSTCVSNSASDGSLGDLTGRTVGTFSLGIGIYYAKEMAVSIYKRDGLVGFLRGLPEYIAYQIIKDIMRYIVPNFVIPLFCDLRLRVSNNLPVYSIMDATYNFRSRYFRILDNSESLFSYFVHYYKNKIKSEFNKILIAAIVEFLTYPVLNVVSKLIIYDGYSPVSFFSLFQNTLTVDGFMALYRGFFYYLISKSIEYVMKNFSKFVESCYEMDYDMDRVSEQTIMLFLSFASGLMNQFSVIQRCGSSLDGLCIKVNTHTILKSIPWSGVVMNLTFLFVLIKLREWLVCRQISLFSVD